MRQCKVCNQKKDLHWFRQRINRHGNLSIETTCTVCAAKKQNDKHRDKRYQMPKSFEQMAKDQEGLCAICKKEPQSKGLNVDHCHKTGRVRALLCTKCNGGIGFFDESIELLEAAIAYLRGQKDGAERREPSQ